MKLTKYIIVFISTILISKDEYSQELQSGQYLPDYTVNNVLNYKSDKLNFKELRGKLIIIDFWGFFCTACLKRFNELESIQKEFNDKIQIIMVNSDKKQETKDFFLARTKLKIPEKIPFITTDTLIHNIFPHDGVPSYVWIDASGKILYRTDQSLTRELLIKYFDSQNFEIAKSSRNKYLSSLFDSDFESSIQYATYISKNIDSVFFHIDNDADNIPYSCRSIQDLYQFAYNESDNEGFYKFREPGRTVLNVENMVKYKYISSVDYDSWRLKYGYYYQAILPSWLKKDKYKIMQKDLERYFNLDAQIEKQNVRCFALIRTSSKDILRTKGGTSKKTDFSNWLAAKDNDPEHPKVRYMKNIPFHDLFRIIEAYGNSQFQIKIVDSTGYNGNIDFEINENVLNDLTIQKLAHELQKYDLDLVQRYIEMDVLVLQEKQ
jgi:thiol-disulfide isomerase/thioredoxin